MLTPRNRKDFFTLSDNLGLRHRLLVGTISSIRSLLSPVALGAHGLVLDGRGRVLLARHTYYDGWALPGGGVRRNEPPASGLLRELKEEVGLVRCAEPELFGVYTRRLGWATNVIALYRVADAVVDFRPNLEVREIMFADPAAPPAGTIEGARRRLAELAGGARPAPYW